MSGKKLSLKQRTIQQAVHAIGIGVHSGLKVGMSLRPAPENTGIIFVRSDLDNQEIKEIITVNGVRFTFEDGSWGLIRASSNKPSLVVVTESPTSDERKLNIFRFIDKTLMRTGKIGEYDQKI